MYFPASRLKFVSKRNSDDPLSSGAKTATISSQTLRRESYPIPQTIADQINYHSTILECATEPNINQNQNWSYVMPASSRSGNCSTRKTPKYIPIKEKIIQSLRGGCNWNRTETRRTAFASLSGKQNSFYGTSTKKAQDGSNKKKINDKTTTPEKIAQLAQEYVSNREPQAEVMRRLYVESTSLDKSQEALESLKPQSNDLGSQYSPKVQDTIFYEFAIQTDAAQLSDQATGTEATAQQEKIQQSRLLEISEQVCESVMPISTNCVLTPQTSMATIEDRDRQTPEIEFLKKSLYDKSRECRGLHSHIETLMLQIKEIKNDQEITMRKSDAAVRNHEIQCDVRLQAEFNLSQTLRRDVQAFKCRLVRKERQVKEREDFIVNYIVGRGGNRNAEAFKEELIEVFQSRKDSKTEAKDGSYSSE